MNWYKVQAETTTNYDMVHFRSSSNDEAIIKAVDIIMDEAFKNKQGPWAVGAIALTTLDGEVLKTMEAKV